MPFVIPRADRAFARLGAVLKLLPLLLLAALAAQAQTGVLTGVVVDEATGETLIGVNVAAFPFGSDTMAGGAATDLDGRYRIAGLPAETYDLVVSYVGYHTQRATGLELGAGATVALDVLLRDEAVQVGEAVVEARALRDSGAALLRERQRVSADPDRTAVGLDLFPAGLLDNIVATASSSATARAGVTTTRSSPRPPATPSTSRISPPGRTAAVASKTATSRSGTTSSATSASATARPPSSAAPARRTAATTGWSTT